MFILVVSCVTLLCCCCSLPRHIRGRTLRLFECSPAWAKRLRRHTCEGRHLCHHNRLDIAVQPATGGAHYLSQPVNTLRDACLRRHEGALLYSG